MKKVDPMAGWYSAQELSGLPGMPGTDRGVKKSALKNLYVSRTKERGKGDEYALRSLPEATRHYILSLAVNAEPMALVAKVATVAKAVSQSMITLPAVAVAVRGQIRKFKGEDQLTDKDRATRDASLLLCRAVEAAQAATKCTMRRACDALSERLCSGEARTDLLAAAQATYVKPRKDGHPLGGISAQTSRLYRMMGFFEKGRMAGDVGQYLVPGKREKEGHNPVHVAAFLRFYCKPSRPPVSEVYREMLPFLAERGLAAPSYSVVCRIEKSLPVTVKYRGRVTGSEWRGLKTYIERDVSMFHSNDIWVGDGHSFKAKVAHPIHGQPYTPEITFLIDWVSRKIVGWSVALSESTVAVSDAFRYAQQLTRARPLVYYSDNGSGQTGKMIDHPIAGTLARQGIAHETGIPGNPQARGIIERIWQITLIALARTYPTCTWKGADDNTTNKKLKALNKKDFGGVALPPFLQLLDDVAECVNHYNLHHEHRELGGNTPEDQYQERLDRDSIVFGPSDTEINALWLPETIRKPQRGIVSLFGNEYCKRDLVNVLPAGSKVRVRYDLHNADSVQLLTMEGLYLGEAKWNGHKVAASPVPEIERLRAVRASGKVKRGEKIIAEAQAELSDVFDMTEAVPMPIPQQDFMPVGIDPDLKDDADELKPFSETVRQFYSARVDDDDEDEQDFEVATR